MWPSVDWYEQRQRLRSVADVAPFIIWMSLPDGYCFYLNPAWEAFTGQKPEDGWGDGWTEMIHPDDREANRQQFEDSWRRAVPCHLRYRLHHRSRGYRWVADIGRPEFGPDGKCRGYYGTVAIGGVLSPAVDDYVPLTKREIQVLQMTAWGMTAGQIATALGLSVRTVEAHVCSCMEKTHSSNRTHAVVEAIRTGQISA